MSSIHSVPAASVPPRLSANERLKHRWNGWLGASISLAVLAHAAVFVLWPHMEVPVSSPLDGETPRMIFVSSVAEVARSAAPSLDRIVAPQLPTVETLDLSLPDDFAVAVPVVGDASAEELIAPPILSMEEEWLDYQSFAPFMVAPAVRNKNEVKRFLERNYQRILEFSGATGVVQVHFWIDESGGIARAEVAESSGSRSLDRLAMRLSRVLQFSPAMRLGRPVRVLVRVPITFRES